MNRPRVIVVGSLNVDIVIRLEFLPSPGETVSGGDLLKSPGGKGGNQAAAAAVLGADVVMVALVGDDAEGRFCKEQLGAVGVDVSLVHAVPGAATGLASVLVDRSGENLIAIAPGANERLDAGSVTTALNSLPDGPAVVIACLEIPLDAVLTAGQLAQSRGWPFVLNPAPATDLPAALLPLVTVLTPNAHEVDHLGANQNELLEAGVGAILITRGSQGAELVSRDSTAARIAAYPVFACDTTGAGDTFTGALGWALASAEPLLAAAKLACAAAALSTLGLGARGALPTEGDVLALVHGAGHQKIGG